MAASTTVATLSDGTDSVDITFSKLDHDFDKQIGITAIPKSTDAENTCPISTGVANPLNLNRDLLVLKQAITVTGLLLEESGDAALTKKDKLEKILSGGADNKSGGLTLQWKVGSTTITKYGTVMKCKVSETPGRVGFFTNTQGKIFAITLQFSVGTHIG